MLFFSKIFAWVDFLRALQLHLVSRSSIVASRYEIHFIETYIFPFLPNNKTYKFEALQFNNTSELKYFYMVSYLKQWSLFEIQDRKHVWYISITPAHRSWCSLFWFDSIWLCRWSRWQTKTMYPEGWMQGNSVWREWPITYVCDIGHVTYTAS